jgi:hypothetical protein
MINALEHSCEDSEYNADNSTFNTPILPVQCDTPRHAAGGTTMNMAVTLPADAPVTVVPPDEPPYDPAAECMKIMMGLEAVGGLAGEKTDSRDHIELMREHLLMPTINRLYEELKGLRA